MEARAALGPDSGREPRSLIPASVSPPGCKQGDSHSPSSQAFRGGRWHGCGSPEVTPPQEDRQAQAPGERSLVDGEWAWGRTTPGSRSPAGLSLLWKREGKELGARRRGEGEATEHPSRARNTRHPRLLSCAWAGPRPGRGASAPVRRGPKQTN